MSKHNANYYQRGSYNCICDICGQKYKREDMRRGGKGYPVQTYLLCYNCWDPVHPVNLPVPVPMEMLPVPDSRPRPNPAFESVDSWFFVVGGPYQFEYGRIVNDFIIGTPDSDFVIGGDQNLPFSADNFPLV